MTSQIRNRCEAVEMKNFQVAYASTATRLFTPRNRLREIAFGYFEIELSEREVQASLYRASSCLPGSLSRDWYQWNGSTWVRTGEDSVKYPSPPVRTGGYRTQVATFEVWSDEPLTEAIKERFGEMLRLFPDATE